MAIHAKTDKEGEQESREPIPPPRDERLLDEREELLDHVAGLQTQIEALQEQLQMALDTLEELLSPSMLQTGDPLQLAENSSDRSRNEQQKFVLLKALAVERSKKGAELLKELRNHRQVLRDRMRTLHRKPEA